MKSENRRKEMLNTLSWRSFPAVPACRIPVFVVRNNASDILVKPILRSDYARIRA